MNRFTFIMMSLSPIVMILSFIITHEVQSHYRSLAPIYFVGEMKDGAKVCKKNDRYLIIKDGQEISPTSLKELHATPQ